MSSPRRLLPTRRFLCSGEVGKAVPSSSSMASRKWVVGVLNGGRVVAVAVAVFGKASATLYRRRGGAEKGVSRSVSR